MNKEENLNEQQFVVKPKLSDGYCEWKRCDFGMMGFHDYEYVTTCCKNYDCDKVKKENFCPNCGRSDNVALISTTVDSKLFYTPC